ncbi:MAG: hypothetical protein LUH47_02630, partial [Clostridiales bacterium]|nr:hypothetical protein [Clostridiales bacterium]
ILTFIFCLSLTAAVFGRVYGGTLLYEMTFHFSFKFLLPVIFGIIAFTAVKLIFKDNISAAVVGVVVLLGLFFFLCFSQIKIYSQYKSGNFTEVSGAVKNFQTSDTEESFTLDGVEFSYKNGKGKGYNLVQSQGGVIKGDSQLIYIRYVEFGDKKVICYIENMV